LFLQHLSEKGSILEHRLWGLVNPGTIIDSVPSHQELWGNFVNTCRPVPSSLKGDGYNYH
jgi:hypothetical protein